MCTMAAASCFPEPFEMFGKRLSWKHRSFAGERFSDHVALLMCFNAWEDARLVVLCLGVYEGALTDT